MARASPALYLAPSHFQYLPAPPGMSKSIAAAKECMLERLVPAMERQTKVPLGLATYVNGLQFPFKSGVGRLSAAVTG